MKIQFFLCPALWLDWLESARCKSTSVMNSVCLCPQNKMLRRQGECCARLKQFRIFKCLHAFLSYSSMNRVRGGKSNWTSSPWQEDKLDSGQYPPRSSSSREFSPLESFLQCQKPQSWMSCWKGLSAPQPFAARPPVFAGYLPHSKIRWLVQDHSGNQYHWEESNVTLKKIYTRTLTLRNSPDRYPVKYNLAMQIRIRIIII